MLLTNRPSSPPPCGAGVRWRGDLDQAVLAGQSRRGRRRQWVYAAAAGRDVVVGAAAVDLGLLGLGTFFAWCTTPDGTWTWEPGLVRGVTVDGVAGEAGAERDGARILISPRRLEIEAPLDDRLQVALDLARGAPVSLLTATPRGGWNATTKAAGHTAVGTVVLGDSLHELDGTAWTDATVGRQDRSTTWRWVAAAGSAEDGRRVGIQASTGMNGVGPGEDLAWWQDEPQPLSVATLAPEAAPDGPWVVAGPDWSLRLAPWGVRAVSEGLGPLRSSYHQPVGQWTGTLPDPSGVPTQVSLRGVAEDHEARW